jgi:hypothetical protein
VGVDDFASWLQLYKIMDLGVIMTEMNEGFCQSPSLRHFFRHIIDLVGVRAGESLAPMFLDPFTSGI